MRNCLSQKWLIRIIDVQGRITGTHWPSTFTNGYITFQILKGIEVIHHEVTKSYPVKNYKIEMNHSFEIDVADDSTEIIIHLISTDIDDITSMPKFIAKCGISVEDIQFQTTVDKYFLLYRNDKLDNQPATGGYIRISLENKDISNINESVMNDVYYNEIRGMLNSNFESYLPLDINRLPSRQDIVTSSWSQSTPLPPPPPNVQQNHQGAVLSRNRTRNYNTSRLDDGNDNGRLIYKRKDTAYDELTPEYTCSSSVSDKNTSHLSISHTSKSSLKNHNMNSVNGNSSNRNTNAIRHSHNEKMIFMFIGGVCGFALGISSSIAVSLFKGCHINNQLKEEDEEMSTVLYMKSKSMPPKNA